MRIASMLSDVVTSVFRRPFTERYPFRVREAPARLRGKLLWDESRCDGCRLCVRDCPARALEVEVVDRAAKKYAYHYRMDRCIYCAQCVVSCTQGALSMSSTEYHLASTDKSRFVEVYRARGTGACPEGEPAP